MKNYSMLLDITPVEFNVIKFVYENLEDKIKSFKLEETFYWDFKHEFEEILTEEYHYILGSGLSKLVLIPLDGDRVIKFPYQRYEGNVLTGAINNSCVSWDYCAAEECISEEAEKDGMGFIFAKTKKCMEIDGYPIYYQPKCITLADIKYDYDSSYYGYESCSEIKKNLHYQNKDFHSSGEVIAMDKIVCDFIKKYNSSSLELVGVDWYCAVKKFYNDSVKRIFDLIKYFHDHEISDLHSNNVGFTLSGQPVLIDYSGFNESSDSYYSSDFSYNSYYSYSDNSEEE